MIRAIVFDLGGVLFAEGKSIAVENLSRRYGYDEKTLEQILVSAKSYDLRRGLITDGAFWRWAGQRLPPHYDVQTIKNEWYEGYVIDADIVDLLARLKKKYRLVAFSGNIKSRIDFLERKYGFRKFFDREVYSFDHHLTKPDPEFAAVMVRESGCAAEEIIYIDDNRRYTMSAAKLGVKVLIYSRGRIEELKYSLRTLGVVI